MTSERETLQLGSIELSLKERPLIMGIVNATPDSFFDRGQYFDANDPGPAVERALALIEDGADIIDVGGETAQPSSPVLDPEEEIRRVVPLIERLAKQTKTPISVDTYKAPVARRALDAGAVLINDTSGLADPTLASIAAESGASIVLMHIPCHPKERLTPGYEKPVEEISAFLADGARRIHQAGVPKEKILLDAGIGFGKTPAENLELIAHFGAFSALGHPLLFACSRRTFLGDLMGGAEPADRLEATVAVNAVAVSQGADIVRVHDVRFIARFFAMTRMVRR